MCLLLKAIRRNVKLNSSRPLDNTAGKHSHRRYFVGQQVQIYEAMHIRHDHCLLNPILIGRRLKGLGHQRYSRLLGRQHIREWLFPPCSAAVRPRRIRISNLTELRRTCTWRRWQDVVPWSWLGCTPGWDSRSPLGGTATPDPSSWQSLPSGAALCLSAASNNSRIPTVVNRQWTRRTCDPSPTQLDSTLFHFPSRSRLPLPTSAAVSQHVTTLQTKLYNHSYLPSRISTLMDPNWIKGALAFVCFSFFFSGYVC